MPDSHEHTVLHFDQMQLHSQQPHSGQPYSDDQPPHPVQGPRHVHPPLHSQHPQPSSQQASGQHAHPDQPRLPAQNPVHEQHRSSHQPVSGQHPAQGQHKSHQHHQSIDALVLPHLKYKTDILLGAAHDCQETLCVQSKRAHDHSFEFERHLAYKHCWGPRALYALRALSVPDTLHGELTYYCLLPACNAQGLSEAHGLDRQQFRNAHEKHPYIVIPSSNHTARLADIDPAIFALALQTTKSFTWRIRKRLHDASQFEPRVEFGADWPVDRFPTSLAVWDDLAAKAAPQYSPAESFSAFLDEKVSKWVKTLVDIDNGLQELFSGCEATLYPSILLSCHCGIFVPYTGVRSNRICEHKPAIFGMSAFYGEYKDTTQAMHMINAVHSVVWLIRIELAYIVQSGHAFREEEKQLRDCAREYDKELLEVIATYQSHIPGSTACHESIGSLMTPLLKHLVSWRDSSHSTDSSVFSSVISEIRTYSRRAGSDDAAYHHLVTVDYLHHWERLHDPGNHYLYQDLRPSFIPQAICFLCNAAPKEFLRGDHFLSHVSGRHSTEHLFCRRIQKTFTSKIWEFPEPANLDLFRKNNDFRRVILKCCVQKTELLLERATSQYNKPEAVKEMSNRLARHSTFIDNYSWEGIPQLGYPQLCRDILGSITQALVCLETLKQSSKKQKKARARRRAGQCESHS